MSKAKHQCPRCAFEGSADLFEPGWLAELEQLHARAAGLGLPRGLADYDWDDRRRLLNFLRREVRGSVKE